MTITTGQQGSFMTQDETTKTDKPVTSVLVKGEEFGKWPEDLYIPPDALEVFLETFQGPLDLLLYLIRKQNLDILDIPVAHVTRQYVEYVELMQKFRLDLAAEYLVMAATLAEIKSRMLLPHMGTAEDGEDEDPRAALVRRLQAYERFRQAAEDIDRLPRVERELYLVGAGFESVQPLRAELSVSLNELVIAFGKVLARVEQNRNWSVDTERLTVREKMTDILDRLGKARFMRFEELFEISEGKHGLVISFMAILELVRDDMLVIIQNEPFSPIHLKRVE